MKEVIKFFFQSFIKDTGEKELLSFGACYEEATARDIIAKHKELLQKRKKIKTTIIVE